MSACVEQSTCSKKSRCSNCRSCDPMPMTEFNKGRRMTYWCWHCTKFTVPTLSASDYDTFPIRPENIPRVPPGSGKSLRGIVEEADLAYFLGQCPTTGRRDRTGCSMNFCCMRPSACSAGLYKLYSDRGAQTSQSSVVAWGISPVSAEESRRCAGHHWLQAGVSLGHNTQMSVGSNYRQIV